MQTTPPVPASLQPAGPAGTNLQQVDTDLQAINRTLNRIAQALIPTPQVVTGSRGSGAALQSLLTALAASGFIVDNTTP